MVTRMTVDNLQCIASNFLLEYALLRSGENKPESGQEVGEAPRATEKPDEEPGIVCRNCGHIITKPSEQIAVQGAHRHTFANPEGIVFEIVCFKQAEGCRYSGTPTEEWSWFRGFRWKFAFCGKCFQQIGWLFVADSASTFNGLIADRLLFPF